jgi:DNA-binding MarR family transcriptional regulator
METDSFLRFRRAYWQALRDLDTVRLRQWEQSRVTLPQLRVLHQVRRTPGITTGELSRILGVSVSTASGLVIKLVDRGLVERRTAPEDRRQEPLFLTTEGQALVGEFVDSERGFLNQVGERLGPEMEVVARALERLADAAAEVRAAEEVQAGAAR